MQAASARTIPIISAPNFCRAILPCLLGPAIDLNQRKLNGESQTFLSFGGPLRGLATAGRALPVRAGDLGANSPIPAFGCFFDDSSELAFHVARMRPNTSRVNRTHLCPVSMVCMRWKQVSALRSERGLRRVSGAEPQVVGLAPQTTMMTERANTMKTYILRDSKTVEPQSLIRSDPAIAAAT